MKLNLFNSETMPRQIGGRGASLAPRVSISRTGVISFNKAAVALMDIKAGDKISFGQEDTEDADWLVFKDPENGFPVRATEVKKSGSAAFNHSTLSKSLFESYGLDDDEEKNTFQVQIASEPIEESDVKYYCLLSIH
jgi:hypothetical protein